MQKSFTVTITSLFIFISFVFILIWQTIWRFTGDGDSMLHYFNLITSWKDPSQALLAWARPAYVALMVIPAHFGFETAKICSLVVTMFAVWQTVKLAEDLQIKNPAFAAVFFLYQPLVFAFAADTMTEIPMALAVVVFLRLWHRGSFKTAMLLLSFLPYFRPEGFFIIGVWCACILFIKGFLPLPLKQRLLYFLFLTPATLVILVLSILLTSDPLFYIHNWSWPLNTYEGVQGDFWHHFRYWPVYCGWVLFPFFILGLFSRANMRMIKPWLIFITVFLTHTILFWKGSFGALGLLRIMACIGPVSALVMLNGYNLLFSRITSRVTASGMFILLFLSSASAAVIIYIDDVNHHRFKLAVKAAEFMNEHALALNAPAFVCSDQIVQKETNNIDDKPIPRHTLSRPDERAMLAALPVGTIGSWDDQNGRFWYGIEISDLPGLGYEILADYEQKVPSHYFDRQLTKFEDPWKAPQRFVVIRKKE